MDVGATYLSVVQIVQIFAGVTILLIAAVVENAASVVRSIPIFSFAPRQQARALDVSVRAGRHLACLKECYQADEFLVAAATIVPATAAISAMAKPAKREAEANVGTALINLIIAGVITEVSGRHPTIGTRMGDVAPAIRAAFTNVDVFATVQSIDDPITRSGARADCPPSAPVAQI